MPVPLGALIELNNHGGDFKTYLNAVYGQFCADFVVRKAMFRGRVISVRKHPPTDGKEYGFWHCISTGDDEQARLPDLDRCERIGWIRTVTEHANEPEVQTWPETRGSNVEHILWFNEEFVVVLSERGQAAGGGPECYLLKTAYCTYREHEKRKKRKTRDAAKKPTPLPKGNGV